MGDIFALQARDNQYLFGRVIRTDARYGSLDELILIYIYRTFSPEKHHHRLRELETRGVEG